jgi:hypothetical protein
MGCNCQMFEAIVGIVVIVFTLWMTSASKWILIIAGVALLLHCFLCKNCKTNCEPMEMKSSKKKRR